MDRNLVYSKTPTGEEATRQRTRVVQRNLRMVLLQVDGQLSVAGLVEKIGNEALVFGALKELEKGGYIALSGEAPSVSPHGKPKVKLSGDMASALVSQISQLSTFGVSRASTSGDSIASTSSQFSTFGKPVMPVLKGGKEEESARVETAPPPTPLKPPKGPGLKERFQDWLASRQQAEPKDLAPYRKKNWGLRIAVTLVAIVALLAGALLFFPFNSYRAPIETALTRVFGQPVRVGNIEGSLYPRPALVLRSVKVGEEADLQIGTVTVPQLWSLYGSGKKSIPQIEVSNVEIKGNFLAGLGRLVEGAKGSDLLALEQVTIKTASLQFGDVAVRDLVGNVNLAAGTKEYGMLVLHTADHALRVEVTPAAGGAAVNLEANGWKASEGSTINFSRIALKGLAQPGRFAAQNAEFIAADGRFVGSTLLDWSNGLSVAAEGALSGLNVRKVATMFALPAEMDGWMGGTLRLRAAGKTWTSMWDAAEANLAVQIERGVLQGVDLGEATRRGSGQTVRGGNTKFERLKGNLLVTSKKLEATELELESGMVQSSGQFSVGNDKVVDGQFVVTVKGSMIPIRAAVRVAGTLPILETSGAR